MPYVILLCTAYSFLPRVLADNEPELFEYVMLKIMGIIIIVLISLSIRGEIRQIISLENKIEYFMSLWNFIDITGLLLTLLITLLMLLELDWI